MVNYYKKAGSNSGDDSRKGDDVGDDSVVMKEVYILSHI
jgi:hypothetical protein